MFEPIKFTVLGEPQALKRHRSFVPKGGSRAIQYDPSSNDKRDFLAKAHENRPEKPIDEPVHLHIRACFGRPGKHFGRRKGIPYLKETSPTFMSIRPDIDNIVKFVMDALNGIFWRDDCLIASLTATKEYVTNVSPCVEVCVMPTVSDSSRQSLLI